jgi:hypothetical protein
MLVSLWGDASNSSFGEGNSWSCHWRDYQLYIQMMIVATVGEVIARREKVQYLDD